MKSYPRAKRGNFPLALFIKMLYRRGRSLIIAETFFIIITAIASGAPALVSSTFPAGVNRVGIQVQVANIPINFIPNVGQWNPKVRFQARAGNYAVFFSSRGVLFTADLSSVIQLQFVVANPNPAIEGLNKLPGTANFFLGNDKKKWHTNVPTYGAIVYKEIYPGIDLVYRGEKGHLKGEFIVSSGADPSRIRLSYEGAKEVRLQEDGTLIVKTGFSKLFEVAPVIYQVIEGKRVAIEGGYHLIKDNEVTFSLGRYDPKEPLFIDPTLVYSTYLGGSESDGARGIAVDTSGNVYITGFTNSSGFPTKNPQQANFGGPQPLYATSIGDAFVAKIDPSGSLVYSTYLGGSDSDEGEGIAVDANGNVYVTGWTWSTNFPAKNSLQPYGGSADAFVAKLDSSGSLIYSTYLGGGENDFTGDIAVSSSGNVYVTGWTYSTNFPIKDPLQTKHGGKGMDLDAFVTEISSIGSLVYSTYLGGSNADEGHAIAVDSSGNAYITGETASADFPTKDPLQPHSGGGVDAFITKMSPSGSLVYSTYLGGSSADEGYGIAVDSSGNAYVTGSTRSTNLATKNAFQPHIGGDQDAFVAKLDPSGSLAYFSYLGGSAPDSGIAIAVDTSGDAYVAGGTWSIDFPTKDSLQLHLVGENDAFVTELAPSGLTLIYSTYLGGEGKDAAYDVAVDSSGNAYVTGETRSTDFPTKNPLQAKFGGLYSDAFIVEIGGPIQPAASFIKGQVTDAVTGKGIVGAEVVVTPTALPVWTEPAPAAMIAPQTWSATTDSNGNYSLEVPEGTYEVIVDARGYEGQKKSNVTVTAGKTTTVNFSLTPMTTDTIPPALITDFTASDGEDGQSTLRWTNPSDSDLAEVIVRRKTGGYPTNHTDGDIAYQNTSPTPGSSVSYTDTGITNGITYYYAVFSCDTMGNWNDQVVGGKNADVGKPSVLPLGVNGIDVSHGSGDITESDWSNLYNKGYKFAFIRATTGFPNGFPDQPIDKATAIEKGFLDSELVNNVSGAQQANILVGVYHFARPDANGDISGAKKEAEWFVECAGEYISNGYLRPALDIEDNENISLYPEKLWNGNVEKLADWIRAWMNTVYNLTHVRPILYMNKSLFEFLKNSSIEDKYDVWIADLKSHDSPNTEGWKDWKFWQYKQNIKFDNIKVDFNLFNGTKEELRKNFVIGVTEANQPPVASFTYSPENPLSGDVVTFDASRSYDPEGGGLTYEWDFEDGTKAEGPIVKHRFTGPMADAIHAETEIVTLTVKDDSGNIAKRTVKVTVYELSRAINICSSLNKFLPIPPTPIIKVVITYIWISEKQGKDVYWIKNIHLKDMGGIEAAIYLFSIKNRDKLLWKGRDSHVGLGKVDVQFFKDSEGTQLAVMGPQVGSKSTLNFLVDGLELGKSLKPSFFRVSTSVNLGSGEEQPAGNCLPPLYIAGILAKLGSPGELRVYDSKEHATGLINGEVKEEIPNSIYDTKNKTVIIFNSTDSYRYEVVGTDTGTYGLTVTSVKGNKATTFTATDIPITKKAVHEYIINRDALSKGEKGVIDKIDENGDGKFNKTITAGPSLQGGNTPRGKNILVDFPNVGANLTFSDILSAGGTFLSPISELPFNLQGLKFLGKFYHFDTTATYKGPIKLRIHYNDAGLSLEEENKLRLYRIEDNGTITDITTAVDTQNNIITGATSGFSYFAVGSTSDTTPPPAPEISSSTHPDQTKWYDNNDPSFSWTEPDDPSGIVGYSYILDHNAATTPDTTVDTMERTKSYTDLTDGTWYFHVRAEDGAGNWGEAASYRINIDTSLPTAEITFPQEGSAIRGKVNITGTAAGGAFDHYYVDTARNGESWTRLFSAKNQVSAGTLATWDTSAVPDGEYTIRLTVVDTHDLSSKSSVGVKVDNTPPVIKDVLPVKGDFASPTPTISATLTDNLSGIDETTITLTLNGEKVNPAPSFDPKTGRMTWTSQVPLPNGDYEVTIDVKDKAGNEAVEAKTSFTVSTKLAIRNALNYPDPCSSGTTFTYNLSQEAKVRIEIYTLAGELIKVIDPASGEVGYNEQYWDGTDDQGQELGNGVYLYRIVAEAGGKVAQVVEKLAVLR